MSSQNITYGLIGIFTLLIGGLSGVLLSQEDLQKTFVCNNTEATATFERLSSTNVTGYWTENGVQKSLVCSKGKWVSINDYAMTKNVSLKDITQIIQVEFVPSGYDKNARQYTCNNIGCTKKVE